MKRIFIIIIFIFITIFLFIKYESTITNKMYVHNIKQYYDEKHDIDVFFLGSSRIYYPMSPMEIWNKYGIISYNRGSSGQYYKLSYLFLEELLSKYSPKIIIFDIAYLETLIFENKYRTGISLSNMKNNLFKLYSYKYIYDNFSSIMENANTINMFHSRWTELHRYDFTYDSFWKGRFSGTYIGNDWVSMHQINAQNKYTNYNISSTNLKNDTIKYANMMVDLATKYNSKILFVKMPYSTNDNALQLDKAFEFYAKEKGWTFINYNLKYDEIKLDFNRDFMDISHLNLYGARKIMDHLIPYIIEHYNIPNRKDDPKYASWNEDYIKYARAVNREEIRARNSFNEWQNLAYYDNYTMLISTNGDNVLNRLPQTMKDRFKSLGLTKYETVQGNLKYAAIIDNNQVFFEEVTDNIVSYNGRMKNIVNLMVSSEPWKATINVSGKPRAKNRYGINFVIYDKVNREIVDSIWIDPAQPDVVRR